MHNWSQERLQKLLLYKESGKLLAKTSVGQGAGLDFEWAVYLRIPSQYFRPFLQIVLEPFHPGVNILQMVHPQR